MSTHNIIYISDGRLDDKIWFITQRVAINLSKKNRVLYVELPKSLTDYYKYAIANLIDNKIRNIFGLLYKKNPRMYVFSPIYLLPLGRWTVIKKLNRGLVIFMVKLLATILRFKDPLLWFEQPADSDYISHVSSRCIVYYCEHDFVTYPMYSSGDARDVITRQEEYLLGKSGIVFCTSPAILEKKQLVHTNAHLMSIGVDVELFARAHKNDTPIPNDITSIPHPIIGFVGALDKYKVDFELLGYLAQSRPAWSIVLLGKIGATDNTTKNDLPTFPNIYYLGTRESVLMPNYLKAFDACIMPYVINDYTRKLTTMKFIEYMATGKPIVMTDLPEGRSYQRVVRIAQTKEEFLRLVEQSLSENYENLINERLDYAKKYDWNSQVNRMSELITLTMKTNFKNENTSFKS